MKAIEALQIARAAIRTSNGAIAVLTRRNSIGEPTVMIVWRDDGSWSTDWLLKKVAGDDWEPLVERLWAGDDIEELEEDNANLRKECDKLTAEKEELAAELKALTDRFNSRGIEMEDEVIKRRDMAGELVNEKAKSKIQDGKLVELKQSLDDALAEKEELTAELEYVGKVVERFKDGSELVGKKVEWEDIPFGTFFWIQFPGHKERLLRCESSRDQKMEATYWKYTGPTTAPIPKETATDEEPDYVVQVDEPTTLADMCDIILAADSTKADKLTAIAMLDEAIDPKPLVELYGESSALLEALSLVLVKNWKHKS